MLLQHDNDTRESPVPADEVMEGVVETVWNEEKFEELDIDMERLDLVAAERDYFVSSLVLKGVEDSGSLLSTASEAFTHQLMSLQDTQLTLREPIELANDETIHAQYSPFLDAPTNTAEDEDAARATLCAIWGRPSNCTFKGRPNHFELQKASTRLFITIGKVWAPDHPEKAEMFFHHLVGLEEGDAEAHKLEDLKFMAAEEPLLRKALDDFIDEVNVLF